MSAEITNYAFYDDKWTVSDSIPSITSLNAQAGYSWVSLSWTPPAGGLTGNLAGYVVCRSRAGATSAPTKIGLPGTNIVYVSNGTHIGDLPLSSNTADLMTADAGLLPGTLYWYSVFVVTTIPAQPANTEFPNYVRGNISNPISIQVTTSSTLPTNLFSVTESNFSTFISDVNSSITPTSGWKYGYVSGNSSQLTPNAFPKGTAIHQNNLIDPNDPIINGTANFNEYMTLQMAYSSCPGLCSPAGLCCQALDCTTYTDPDCSIAKNLGTPCGCAAGATAEYTKIYYTYSPQGGLIPGTLYSFSIWFRTNNPISALAATNGNDQSYTPVFSVYGNSEPNSPDIATPQPLGITQIEQVMVNEGSFRKPTAPNAVACSHTDSMTCTRLPGIGGGLNSSSYSGLTSLWQRASLTFIIGSTSPSLISSTYNNDGTSGDPVQSPYIPKSKLNLPIDALASITVVIEIPQNAPGNTLGVMDFADAWLVEGLLPYTDPFWNIKEGDNLIFNPNFWGVQTLTQGTAAANWVCPAAIDLIDATIACGPVCNGNCITCQATGSSPPNASENCKNTCTGSCNDNVCSTGIGNCQGTCTGICAPAQSCSNSSGSCLPKCGTSCINDTCPDNSGTCETLCTGTCGPDPEYLCTGTTGSCTDTCSMTNATCSNESGTCLGTCTGDCVFTAPTCHGFPDASCTCICHDNTLNEPCYYYEDPVNSITGCYLPNGQICNNNTCATDQTCTSQINGSCIAPQFNCNNGNNGTCFGSCTGTCSSTCDSLTNPGSCTNSGKATDPCTGTCTLNEGICQGGSGSCAGGVICFNTASTQYTDVINDQLCPTTLTESDSTNTTTYFVLKGCSCKQIQIQAGNIAGISSYYVGSFSLALNTTYTFSFEAMVLENDSVSNALAINIADMTTTMLIDSGNPICDKNGKINCTSSFSFPAVTKDSPQTIFKTYSFTFQTLNQPINPNIYFVLYRENMTIALKGLKIAATGDEVYGIQNPFPTIATPPSTTKANAPQDAITWNVPSSVQPGTSPASVLYNQTGQNNGTQLGWPQGLVLMNAFHTYPSMDMIAIVKDTDPTASTITGGSSNVMAITVENLSGDKKTSDQSAFLMSNAYYGSGQWDIWVKIATVYEPDGKTPMTEASPNNPSTTQPVNPTGCSFAFWVYHAISYEVAGGPKLLYEPNALRNTEIDIEMNGACPDYSNNFANNTGRLNGWGGQWGGSGANFTMHTQMPASPLYPNGINLNDGQYHKLSILFHSGVDPTPDKIDPNGTYPNSRAPGFVKWFVDDIEWGCGWTGNTYGLDNIPMTATRIVAGPWNPDWAGCKLCCENCPANTNAGALRSGCCAGSCPTSFGTKGDSDYIPVPTCNLWGSAVFYVAQMKFTPTCIDCDLPCTKDINGTECATPYYPAVALPSRPDASVLPNNGDQVTFCDPTKTQCPNNIGISNRNRWLAETKPYLTFPTID